VRHGDRRAPPGWCSCAIRDSLTSEAYVAQCAWQRASLAGRPRHPGGGCGFARNGTYPRQTPAGMRIARYYCPTAHETFSLLPDCLASRFPGDLDDLERVVAHVEAALSIVRVAIGRAARIRAAAARRPATGPHARARRRGAGNGS